MKLKLQIKSLPGADTPVQKPRMCVAGTTGTVQLPVSPSKHHTPAESPPVTSKVLLAAWQKPGTGRSCTSDLGSPVTDSTPKSESRQPTATPAVPAPMGTAAAPQSQGGTPGSQPDLVPTDFSTRPLLETPPPPGKTSAAGRLLQLNQCLGTSRVPQRWHCNGRRSAACPRV